MRTLCIGSHSQRTQPESGIDLTQPSERRAVSTMDTTSHRDPLGFRACPTGKREYRDERTAVAALRAIRRRGAPDRTKGVAETAAYPCGACSHWHLTAAPQTKRRTGAPRSRSRR